LSVVGATALVAILFTDLVGSTEAASRLGEGGAETFRQTHFALLREGIRDHGGTEVKNLGDGLMVAFAAASDAVACAVAMQQALARHNRRGGEAMTLRVGVAVGVAVRVNVGVRVGVRVAVGVFVGVGAPGERRSNAPMSQIALVLLSPSTGRT